MFWVFFFLLMSAAQSASSLSASPVTFTGKENLPQALAALAASGNPVLLAPEVPRDQTPAPLPAATLPFWQAVDTLCRTAKLTPRWRDNQLLLVPDLESHPLYAYDGPFRVALKQCSVAIHPEDPAADRLTVQVELASEPKLHPLLFALSPSKISWEPAFGQPAATSNALLEYRFDAGPACRIDLRLPRPPRALEKLTSLTLQGTLWVSTKTLEFPLALRPGAAAKQDATLCRITAIDVDQAGRTWELAAKILYPEASLEWESNQAGLLGHLGMVLINDQKQKIPAVGRQVRTDSGRELEVRWIFRNVPGNPASWRAVVQAPSAPLAYPLRLTLRDLPLP
jgi:hypothetical protein